MYNDKDYYNIVNDIVTNKEFLKLKSYKHHGITRYEHVERVSYWSYKVGKKLGLDYTAIARAGLLHDFFLISYQSVNIIDKFKVFFGHPKIALENSKKYFKLNKKEENIILSHMFPATFRLPLSFEAWLVNIIDDVGSICDRFDSIFKKKR